MDKKQLEEEALREHCRLLLPSWSRLSGLRRHSWSEGGKHVRCAITREIRAQSEAANLEQPIVSNVSEENTWNQLD